ncbi:GNAT family N-acetyltransferase [Pantoea sp. SOD02]|uniref:GNAT family N-acetyltransferase n=1 Tax=Pantoea sp. SOD02 TaxID=2970818 RepID=UPI0021574325|nr:GNAT family N-acetyltransferase [Pantoea sp. SOD02]UVC28081.1 GNAT family N-acetyltransferase [Pantoea sp. SOD02]
MMTRETFLQLYERQLAALKKGFTAPATADWQQAFSQFKQWRQQHQPQDVAVADFSSMFAVPTSRLTGSECMLHRVWLGGSTPLNVNRTLAQWQRAIEASHSDFQQTLWVWDAQQLAADNRFVAQQADSALQLGTLFLPDALVQVNSLSALMNAFDCALADVLQQLHDKRYYATLSDFFRLAILTECGGVYLDADTIPAQPATLFLCQPELPDFPGEQQQISWLNLFTDETGMIISHQNNPVLQDLQRRLSEVYRGWPQPIAAKTPDSERAIFEPFYQLWCEQLQVTQLSHQDFSCFAVCGFDAPTPRVCGIKGMRLQEDILSGERRPLSVDEQHYYQQTVNQLSQRDWQLSDPLQLGELVPLFAEQEILQIAYAPQLRAEIPYYHYYGVLCQDPQLDKVNELFCDYLIASIDKKILDGGFWQPVYRPKSSALIFKPGVISDQYEQRRMAQLIFSTSYLEYCSVDNIYAADLTTLQLRQNIQPFLQQISVMYNPQGKMIGFLNAASIKEYDQIKVEYGYRKEVRALDEAYDDFVNQYSQPDDYFICSVAFLPEEQGKGCFNQVLSRMIEQAKQQKLRRITLCVWQSNPAYTIYRKKGFTVIDRMKQEVARFNDEIVFMALTL